METDFRPLGLVHDLREQKETTSKGSWYMGNEGECPAQFVTFTFTWNIDTYRHIKITKYIPIKRRQQNYLARKIETNKKCVVNWGRPMYSWNWRDFMTNVHGCAFLLDFTFENQGIGDTQWRIFFVWAFSSKSKSLFSVNHNRVSLRCRVGHDE